MTITHDLYSQVQDLLKARDHNGAIDLLVHYGWDRADARKQVGAVAAEMRTEALKARERKQQIIERREARQNRLL